MGKLNSEQRKKVGENCISVSRKNSAPKQVIVYTSSNAAGLAVKSAISAAYPSYKFYKAESIGANVTGQVLFGIFTLGAGNLVQGLSQTWKNFTVKTGSDKEAADLVQEIESCINEYGDYGSVYEPEVTNDYPNTSTTTTSTGNSILGGNSTYIIIGAAAIIILLILWNSKRK